jgi:hypothetical protein
VVIVNTPAKPSAAAKNPMIAGAVILPVRPKALDMPVAVLRTQVGNTSGVEAYRPAYTPLRKNDSSAPLVTMVGDVVL